MEDVAMGGEGVGANIGAGLDMSSAMVRAECVHLDATLHALVKRLSVVPGLEVAVSPGRGKFRRLIGDLPYVNELHRSTDRVRRIVVVVGRRSYWLHSDTCSITCGRDVSSIDRARVKEELPFSVWAAALFDEIAQQNLVNHDSMAALRCLVEQDRVN